VDIYSLFLHLNPGPSLQSNISVFAILLVDISIGFLSDPITDCDCSFWALPAITSYQIFAKVGVVISGTEAGVDQGVCGGAGEEEGSRGSMAAGGVLLMTEVVMSWLLADSDR